MNLHQKQVGKAVSLTNFSASGVVGTALATVDGGRVLSIAQTTAGIILSLPNPTDLITPFQLLIRNTGTVSFKIGQNLIGSGSGSIYSWAAGVWGLVGPINAAAILPVTITNKTINGSIGTAAATVDVSATFILLQTTVGISLTVPVPTVNTSAGRIIYFLNNGTAPVSVAGVPIQVGTDQYFGYDGISAWLADSPSTSVDSPDNTKTILVSNQAISATGPFNLGSQPVPNQASGTLVASTTVDKASTLILTQITASVVLLLPAPTTSTVGRLLNVLNGPASTVSVTVGGVVLPISSLASFVWDGTKWDSSLAATATTVSNGIGVVVTTVGSNNQVAIANTGVTAGTYTSPNIVVNAQGQISNATSVSLAAVYGQASPAVASLTVPALGSTATAQNYIAFTLPNAGTWEVEYQVRGSTAPLGQAAPPHSSYIIAGIFTSAAALLANTEIICTEFSQTGTNPIASSFNVQSMGTGIAFITTAGPTSYYVGVWNIGADQANTYSDVNGRSQVTYKQISGFLPVSTNVNLVGDGTANGVIGTATTLTLANTGVTAGTYSQVTVNSKGLVVSGVAAVLAGSNIVSLSADQPLTLGTGYTFYTSLAITLPAGTYLLLMNITVSVNLRTLQSTVFTLGLLNQGGSSYIPSRTSATFLNASSTTQTILQSMSGACIAVLAGTNTIVIEGQNIGAVTGSASLISNTGGGGGSGITFIRLA